MQFACKWDNPISYDPQDEAYNDAILLHLMLKWLTRTPRTDHIYINMIMMRFNIDCLPRKQEEIKFCFAPLAWKVSDINENLRFSGKRKSGAKSFAVETNATGGGLVCLPKLSNFFLVWGKRDWKGTENQTGIFVFFLFYFSHG